MQNASFRWSLHIVSAVVFVLLPFTPLASYMLYLGEIRTLYADQPEIAAMHLRMLPWLTAGMSVFAAGMMGSLVWWGYARERKRKART